MGAANFLPARFFVIMESMAAETVIAKKRKGPPPTGKGTPVVVRMQPPALSALDAWRRAQEDLPSRPEAVRRLIEHGLEWSKRLSDAQASKRIETRAHGDKFATAAAGKRVDKAQAHEKPGTGRGTRKRALTEIPKDLLAGGRQRTK